jgi:UDP-N-acetylmuramyl tripeptide synthase
MEGDVDLPLRTRMATLAGRLVAEVSRRAGTGAGSNVGGKVTLALDPRALELMAAGRRVALVSGTNGKTTTTRLVTAALATRGSVATNSAGANLLPGLVSTLARDEARHANGESPHWAALEVDEGLLGRAVAAVRPAAIVLLNLSRDQLDRIGEVRLHAEAWRRAVDGAPASRVVANADDPLVTWAARAARMVTWVGTGQRWRADAASCPACGNRILWTPEGEGPPVRGGSPWGCTACGLGRPEPALWLEGDELVTDGGSRIPIRLRLPGWCNLANAAMAAAGAAALGIPLPTAVAAMATVGTVEGRYEVVEAGGARVRLLLAKNPAGWAEAIDLLRPPPVPVVVAINARVADGHDPSWLWDVPFERLQGRFVVATGDRGRDLAVRLRYASVQHTWAPGWREALAAAGAPEVDLVANYTAFQDARRALRGSR